MRIIKIIRLFYILYTVYTLFVMTVSDYKFSYAFIGILFVWATYFGLKLGFCSTKGKAYNTDGRSNSSKTSVHDSFPLSNISFWPVWKYIIALITSWISAILTARFYTGRNFTLVIQGVLGDNSAYNSYQSYFVQNNIGSFSISKIPYILMLAYLTIITIWSIVGILLSNRKNGIWRVLYVIGVTLAYAYFGAARGTNFETYIIFIILAYCLLQKSGGIKGKSLKYLLIVIIAGIILVFIFRARVIARGVEFQNNICPEITFNNNSFLARNFPSLVNIGLSVFGYLGYGIFCIGVTISDICFRSVEDFVGFLIPFGHRIFNDATLSDTLSHTISMGARWTPDFVNLIDVTGILLYFVVLFLLGKFLRKSYKIKAPDLLKNIIGALIFIEMLSIPVGNFLVASTSNEIMLLFVLIWVLQYGGVQVTLSKSRRIRKR